MQSGGGGFESRPLHAASQISLGIPQSLQAHNPATTSSLAISSSLFMSHHGNWGHRQTEQLAASLQYKK